jgi:hypothetical protein
MAEKSITKFSDTHSRARRAISIKLLWATAVLVGTIPLWRWALPALPDAFTAVLAMGALLLLPGLMLLRLFWPASLAADMRWPLAIGLSCAALPLVLLVSDVIGLRWNGTQLWGMLALCGIVACLPQRRRDVEVIAAPRLEHGLLIALTFFALLIRLYAARDLLVGQYGDSYHHTVIAQLISDHGGLFRSWEPYEPFTSFTYHFGFHSLVAALNWLSNVPVTRGVLIVGQVQNALAVPLVYLLTVWLTGQRRAGLWAALLVAVVSSMPAYYLNWGRYTQLAGQTVLVAVCITWMELLDQSCSEPRGYTRVRLLVLTTTANAGLALTHYRVAIFALCFVLVYGGYLLVARLRTPVAFWQLVRSAVTAGLLSLLLTVPWLVRVYEGSLPAISGAALSSDLSNTLNNTISAEHLMLSVKPYLVALALLGVALLLARQGWRSLILPSWAGCTWLAANPQLLGLSGSGMVSSFAVLIASYLVLAPLAGSALALSAEKLASWFAYHSSRLRRLNVQYGQLFLALALAIWGMHWQSRIADPHFQLFTPADAAAMEWIRRSTSHDARFYVNSFTAYGDTVYAGSDGGWWLPFLSGRASNLPNILYGIETGSLPGLHQRVFRENEAIQAYPIGSPQAANALRSAGYAYLYNGPSANPPDEYITVAQLVDSPYFEEVYNRDGVTIWRIR